MLHPLKLGRSDPSNSVLIPQGGLRLKAGRFFEVDRLLTRYFQGMIKTFRYAPLSSSDDILAYFGFCSKVSGAGSLRTSKDWVANPSSGATEEKTTVIGFLFLVQPGMFH